MERLTALKIADFGGKYDHGDPTDFLELLRKLDRHEGALTLKTLAVKGTDLMMLGIPSGPEIGRILGDLLARVIAGELPNERAALLDAAFADSPKGSA